jgi:hypothetical protein
MTVGDNDGPVLDDELDFEVEVAVEEVVELEVDFGLIDELDLTLELDELDDDLLVDFVLVEVGLKLVLVDEEVYLELEVLVLLVEVDLTFELVDEEAVWSSKSFY